MNYYNEYEPSAAAWLQSLIDAGQIPAGVIDTRSIEDVHPSDLRGFKQCHFFAGIGGWSVALRIAEWPADRNVWTGSCPCQPFSAAGAGAGFADERHLWPAFFHLIRECRPAVVFGEQVASAAVGPWIDLVSTDLEALDYAFGAIAFPAAGVGAPHIRDRTYWVGHANNARLEGFGSGYQAAGGRVATLRPVAEAGEPVRLADADGISGGQGRAIDGGRHPRGDAEPWPRSGSGGLPGDGGMADADCGECHGVAAGEGREPDRPAPGWIEGDRIASTGGQLCGERPGPVNGHWRAADWLGCRDGKWRPVEPGTFPLAHGLPARVGRLRGYGNAIVPQQAAEFILAAEESRLIQEAA